MEIITFIKQTIFSKIACLLKTPFSLKSASVLSAKAGGHSKPISHYSLSPLSKFTNVKLCKYCVDY